MIMTKIEKNKLKTEKQKRESTNPKLFCFVLF